MSFNNEIWLAIRTNVADGAGDGTPGNPFAANTAESFANIMRNPLKIPANALIRLGPGVFRTRGRGGNGYVMDDSKLWRPRSGQKISGSGMFSTTLMFDFDLPLGIIRPQNQPGQRHFMINNDFAGEDYLSSWELSDLTLDCNLQNAPFDEKTIPTAPVTATVTPVAPATTSAIVTTSGSFFNPDMVGKAIVFTKVESNGSVTYPGSTIASVDSDIQVTMNLALPAMSGAAFGIFGPRLTVTAVAVAGDNIRLRRLRVINFGSRTPIYFDGREQPPANNISTFNRSYEGFPLRINGRTTNTPSFNSLIEDCVIEQPYPFPAREVTFVVGGGIASEVAPPSKLHLEPMACGIRNCYMNFDFVNAGPGNPVGIAGIAFSGSGSNVDATVTTYFPLYVKVDDYVEMYGNDVSALNGRFKVTAIGSPDPVHKLVLTFTIRISAIPDPLPETYGHAFKSAKPTMRAELTRNLNLVTVTTVTNHNRDTGDYVSVAGAIQEDYNGTWEVTWVSDTQFSYQLPSGKTPSSPAEGEIWLDRRPNQFVKLKNVKRIADDSGGPRAEFEFYVPPYFKPGEWINPWQSIQTAGAKPRENSYNNYLEVLAINIPEGTTFNPLKIVCRLPGTKDIGGVNSAYSQENIADSGFGNNYQAIYANGGFGGGVHSNRFAHADRGAYHDHSWHRHLIVRKNYFYNVKHGVHFPVLGTYALNDPRPAAYDKFSKATVNSVTTETAVLIWNEEGADPGFIPGVAVRFYNAGNQNIYTDGEVTLVEWEDSKYKSTVRFRVAWTSTCRESAPLLRSGDAGRKWRRGPVRFRTRPGRSWLRPCV
jgi:hypothetical protein